MGMSATRKLLILNLVLAVVATATTWSLRQEPQIPPNNPVDENVAILKVSFPEEGVSIIEEGSWITEIHRNSQKRNGREDQ